MANNNSFNEIKPVFIGPFREIWINGTLNQVRVTKTGQRLNDKEQDEYNKLKEEQK